MHIIRRYSVEALALAQFSAGLLGLVAFGALVFGAFIK